jgi:organic radical activating enzyme
MHLHTGFNHSCHHPATHQTPLSELKLYPSALHNTLFKKDQRRKMKEGQRPAECDYCWKVEDLKNENLLSERVLKSSSTWALPHLEEVRTLPADANINPTYAEVSFSNVCQFRCSYCSANFSTRWDEDLRKSGPYRTRAGERTMTILKEDENPYVEAFWKWWPDLVRDLKVFRITGGEPLLSPNTFRVLDDLSKNPQPHLEVAVNSNLGLPEGIFQKFVAQVKELTEAKKVRGFFLYTSVEAWGERAEYIRNGLSFMHFQKNLEYFLSQVPNATVTIMSTFNLMSVTSFRDFLIYFLEVKKRFEANPGRPMRLDTSFLRYPGYMAVELLPPRYQSYMDGILEFMEANQATKENRLGFDFVEINSVRRIAELMKAPKEERDLKSRRAQFHSFFTEHDSRRGTSFPQVFPEMDDFRELCRKS